MHKLNKSFDGMAVSHLPQGDGSARTDWDCLDLKAANAMDKIARTGLEMWHGCRRILSAEIDPFVPVLMIRQYRAKIRFPKQSRSKGALTRRTVTPGFATPGFGHPGFRRGFAGVT